MKKVLLIIGLVLLVGVASIFAFLSYSGMLTEFEFKGVEMQGPHVILCEAPGTNDYIDLSSKDVDLSKIVTIFFEVPIEFAGVETDQIDGFIVEKSDYDKLDELEKDYEIITFPEQECLIAEFPYKNFVSIFFGTLKAYIALESYLTENKLSGMDLLLISDTKNDKLTYLFFFQPQE